MDDVEGSLNLGVRCARALFLYVAVTIERYVEAN
jgi:hypothetical protein